MKTVSIIGLGYIGLPTALVAAKYGFEINGFDVDSEKVKKINSGVCPISEPGLQEFLNEALKNNFKAYDLLQPTDYFIITVPTPLTSDKKADLSYVFDAAKNIAKVIKKNNCVILESTVSVGTTEEISKIIESESGLKSSKDFFVAHCPERVLPGKILEELIINDRIVGGICQKSSELSKEFYEKFVTGKIYLTDDKTAEFVKLIENSHRDVEIAFANQVANMCEEIEIDTFETIKLANKHPRVNILNPGCGVGGHCIAVDPYFLIEKFPKNSSILHEARKVNSLKPKKIIFQTIEQIKKFFKKQNRIPKVLALGLTFKPDVDDLRESPALQIATELNKKKDTLDLSALEPNIDVSGLKQISKIEEIKNFDIILALVKHSQFKQIKSEDLENKIVIDPCGLFHETDSFREGKSKTIRGINSSMWIKQYSC